MRQSVGEDQLLPACIPGAQVEDVNVPDTIHSSLKHTLPPNDVADFPLDPYLDNMVVYPNSDPEQGLDFEATQQARDWPSRG